MARTGLALLIVCLAPLSSRACSVPLFRYALERWPPSPYELVVFHRGPLSAADRDRIRNIRDSGRSANLKVSTADLDLAGQLNANLAAIWAAAPAPGPLPRAVLRYPDSGPKAPPVWAGPLAEATGHRWLDSPARRALFDRLTAGHAGVILLLLSGDASADDAARGMLRRELPDIARRIELPARTDDGPQVMSELPVRVEFPVVEVSRTPEEDGLVRLLLGSEEGLKDVRGPIAFPVFGRGRALCSLHGKDLQQPGELQRALEYLCRACSCQAKELNPGLDLLVSGDWETIFDADRGPVPREVSTRSHRAEPRPDVAAGPEPGEARRPPPAGYEPVEVVRGAAPEHGRGQWPRYGTAAMVLVLVTGVWVLGRRGRGAGRP